VDFAIDFAVDFLAPLFPLAFDEAGFEVGVAGSASACGEDAARLSARRPTSVIGLPTANTQVGLHLPEPVLYKLLSLHEKQSACESGRRHFRHTAQGTRPGDISA
jgi:hypothetical protein